MAHYPVEAWLDYVCGCVPEEARGRMARHASECERCGRLADGLEAMRTTLIADRRDAVPDHVVEAAARIFKNPPKTRRPRMRRRGSDGRASDD